jgi:hypothetical protein
VLFNIGFSSLDLPITVSSFLWQWNRNWHCCLCCLKSRASKFETRLTLDRKSWRFWHHPFASTIIRSSKPLSGRGHGYAGASEADGWFWTLSSWIKSVFRGNMNAFYLWCCSIKITSDGCWLQPFSVFAGLAETGFDDVLPKWFGMLYATVGCPQWVMIFLDLTDWNKYRSFW